MERRNIARIYVNATEEIITENGLILLDIK